MPDHSTSSDFANVITATLSVGDWAKAMQFYKAAFGAVERYCVEGGGVAELAVGGATFWVAEESVAHQNFSPATLGGCSVRMLLMVEDPEGICARAIQAGATLIRAVTCEHGWVLGRIADPSGHHWEIGRRLG